MMNSLLAKVEKSAMKAKVPKFSVGDQVDVHVRILEGEKERIQIFSGTVIARAAGGSRETFTVRRTVQGEGVERKFPLHSPKIAKIKVNRSGRARRQRHTALHAILVAPPAASVHGFSARRLRRRPIQLRPLLAPRARRSRRERRGPLP